MYNDEFPNGTSSETAAHAKGVVAFDGTGTGFWLVHSVPRFPPTPGPNITYSFPATGFRYGQTMLCISLALSQADLIGECRVKKIPLVSTIDCDESNFDVESVECRIFQSARLR